MSRMVRVLVAAALGVGPLAVSTTRADGGTAGYVYCHRFDAYEKSDCGATHRIAWSPVGRQLRWVLAQFAGDAATLTENEVVAHVDPRLLAVFPAPQIVAVFQSTLQQVGPAGFVGFDYPARRYRAVALAHTKGFRAAVPVRVDPATGLIVELGLTAAPPTIVPHGRYSGWFEVAGRRLFLRCTGHGSPTVVFENGLTTDWYHLQNTLSPTTRVCSYDPALQDGAFSHSDPAPTPRTGADRVRDLHRLLRAAGLPGRIVLAGHSNGGLFSLLYAARHPRQVAGLVLIDGVHPGYHRREVQMLKRHLSPATWRQFAAHNCDIPPAVADPERMDICRSEQQTRRALADHPLRPMPLAVISHGVVAPGTYPKGWPAHAEERLWTRLQNELAALEPGSEHVIATRSDHDIQHEQPHLVSRETALVITAVRSGHTTLR